MHLDLTLLTALAVLLHLGTSAARAVLKDSTDRKKIAAIDTKVDRVLGVVAAIAPALPAAAPRTVAQVASDLANVAQALAAATAAAGGTD